MNEVLLKLKNLLVDSNTIPLFEYINIDGKEWNGKIYYKKTEDVGSLYLDGEQVYLNPQINKFLAKSVINSLERIALESEADDIYNLFREHVIDNKGTLEDVFKTLQTEHMYVTNPPAWQTKHVKYILQAWNIGAAEMPVTHDVWDIVVKTIKKEMKSFFAQHDKTRVSRGNKVNRKTLQKELDKINKRLDMLKRKMQGELQVYSNNNEWGFGYYCVKIDLTGRILKQNFFDIIKVFNAIKAKKVQGEPGSYVLFNKSRKDWQLFVDQINNYAGYYFHELAKAIAIIFKMDYNYTIKVDKHTNKNSD